MKRLFFMIGCLALLGSSPAWAAPEDPDMIVVRIDIAAQRVIITRGEGKSEATKFSVGLNLEKAATDINEVYFTTIKRLQQEGYTLQQQLANTGSSSTLLFVKAPKP